MPIHTFSIELTTLKKKECRRARNQLYALCRCCGSEKPACAIHYKTRDSKKLLFHFRDYPGISLSLLQHTFPRLEMRINPSITIGNGYDALYTFREYEFHACEWQVNSILQLLQLPYRFTDMRLTRCDCTFDIDLSSGCTVEELLRCIRKTTVSHGYKPTCFDESFPNWREKNKHSFRVLCRDIELTAYDKSFQLLEEDLMPADQIPQNRLRLEAAFSAHAFQRVMAQSCQPVPETCTGSLRWFSDKSIELLLHYFGRVLSPGEYLRFSSAVQRIKESGYQQKTKEDMTAFLYLVSRKNKKGISGAIKEFQEIYLYTPRQISLLMERFKELNLNPATLPESCSQQQVPSLLDLLKTASQTNALPDTAPGNFQPCS